MIAQQTRCAILREMRAGGNATRGIVAWLRRAGLNFVAAEALEAFAPLATIGAQLGYMADPFISGSAEFGRQLENPEELIRQLRDVEPQQ